MHDSNHRISACPNLAIQLLQILIPTTFNSLLYQKRQFTLLLRLGRFVRKIFGCCLKKVVIERFSEKYMICMGLGPSFQQTAYPKRQGLAIRQFLEKKWEGLSQDLSSLCFGPALLFGQAQFREEFSILTSWG